MRSATSVRTKKAQGGFLFGDGGVETSVGITNTFQAAPGICFNRRGCFEAENFLMVFGLATANSGQLHDLLLPHPPSGSCIGHQSFKKRLTILALYESPQFVDRVGSRASDPMLRNTLCKVEHIREKPPCFPGFQHLADCGERRAGVQSDTQNGEINTRFGTPLICVSAGNGRRCTHANTEAVMTDDGIREELEKLHGRIDAQRAVFTVMATVIADIEPKAREEIMRGLAGFERALRQNNERASVLTELRAVREILDHVGKPEGSQEQP